jgi:DNA (cytosine-5)-methyltransferase 1
MGAGDFNLKGLRDSQALFGFGDAVFVPAVSWLAENYLVPLLNGAMQGQRRPLLRPLTA